MRSSHSSTPSIAPHASLSCRIFCHRFVCPFQVGSTRQVFLETAPLFSPIFRTACLAHFSLSRSKRVRRDSRGAYPQWFSFLGEFYSISPLQSYRSGCCASIQSTFWRCFVLRQFHNVPRFLRSGSSSPSNLISRSVNLVDLVLFVRLILLLLRCFKVKHSLLHFLPFALFWFCWSGPSSTAI